MSDNIREAASLSMSLRNQLSELDIKLDIKSDEANDIYEVPVRKGGVCNIVGGYTTLTSSKQGNYFSKLASITIESYYRRFDGVFSYMLGKDSTPNRGGVGFINVQIIPAKGLSNATIVLDVAQILPFTTGIKASDFSAVITKATGDVLEVELYYRVGADNYSSLCFQPMLLNMDKGHIKYEFFNQSKLISELPNRTVVHGSGKNAPNLVAPAHGVSVPSSIPSVIGAEYLDTTNKKLYKAFGTSSASDWILMN